MKSADVARYRMTGRGTPPARRSADDGAMSVQEFDNARRYSEYVARVQGVREPLIRIWRA